MVDTKLIETEQKCDETLAKRARVEDEDSVLNQFEFVKVLNDNTQSKMIIIQAEKKAVDGCIPEGNQNAVIILEKPHFNLEETKSYLSIQNPTETYISNDIYRKMSVYPTKPYNNIQAQLIYPATEQHIQKYSSQEFFFLVETYQDYLDITSKYIKSTQFTLEWVYNILEHKKESERIVLEDADAENGFILLPDMKWDGTNVSTMSLLAIVHNRSLNSLRDLDGTHLPLLENIREKCLQAIEEKYGVKRNNVRAFLHYQPTFYHVHVHFAHLSNPVLGMPERNFSLNHVIENLKVDSDYYKKVAIEYVLRRNEKLYDLFKSRFE